MNSYFLTVQAVIGPLAVFAQSGFGGAYMESASTRAQGDGMVRLLGRLLDAAANAPDQGGHRLIVLDCDLKSLDVCQWVALDRRPRPELTRIAPLWHVPTSLYRAVQELSQLGRERSGTSVRVAVEFEWTSAGEVHLVDDSLRFPDTLPAEPGLYRFVFSDSEHEKVYIGEASDLRRRAGHYRRGDESQPTNERLHRNMREHLAGGGTIRMDSAREGAVITPSDARPLDFTTKRGRLVAEAAAVQLAPTSTLLNLPGIGDRGRPDD